MRVIATGTPVLRDALLLPLVGPARWVKAFEIQVTWRGVAVGTYLQRGGHPYIDDGGEVAREWSWHPWFGRWRDGRPWWWDQEKS